MKRERFLELPSVAAWAVCYWLGMPDYQLINLILANL
jgi:hypothetical protein